MPRDLSAIRRQLTAAIDINSENQLLALIRSNSFLLYPLYTRKFTIGPPFHELSFGGERRCDFAWLNDDSDGPEWVLVEMEPPAMRLFNADGYAGGPLHHGIEQIRSWRRYFNENPGEKRRIFGAVANFRFILVGGTRAAWAERNASRWRIDMQENERIEIRSSGIFMDAINECEVRTEGLWSFDENPFTLPQGGLANYVETHPYLNLWRQRLT